MEKSFPSHELSGGLLFRDCLSLKRHHPFQPLEMPIFFLITSFLILQTQFFDTDISFFSKLGPLNVDVPCRL